MGSYLGTLTGLVRARIHGRAFDRATRTSSTYLNTHGSSRAREFVTGYLRELRGGSSGDSLTSVKGRGVFNHISSMDSSAHPPTETEALLGSPEAATMRRSRDTNGDAKRVRWIVHSIAAIATVAVALAVFGSDARGWATRVMRPTMGGTDPRPFIVDFGDSVSPSFRHQAYVYRCQDDYDLHTKLTEMNHHGMFDYYKETQVTVGEPNFGKCYNKHFSSSFGTKPVFNSEMKAHKGKMIGMFRMPAQKIAAGFVNAFESCPRMQHEHGVQCNPAHQSYAIGSCAAAVNPTPENVEKYYNCVKGCQVNMLNGNFCGGANPKCVAAALADMPNLDAACDAPHSADEKEIQNAISKITDGHFAVVGLAEKYADSVRKLRKYLTGQGANAAAAVGAFEKANGKANGHKNGAPKVAKVGIGRELEPLVPFGEGPDVMKAAEAKVAEILRQKGLRDIADERLHSAAYDWFDKHGW